MSNFSKPGRGFRTFLTLLLLSALCLGLFAACGSEPEEPVPTAVPSSAPSTEPPVIVNPVNGPSPEDINDTLKNLSENSGVLVPAEGGYVYTDEEGDVTLTVTDPAEVREVLEAQPLSGEEDVPSVVTGIVDGVSYLAVSADGNVTVYITVGDQTVKAKAETKSGKADAKTVKKAASVAGSVAKASKVKEPYERGRDDYDHNKAAYYMDAADCLIFYPAQLTKKTAFEDQSVIFSDARSSVTCSARLERNPYTDIDELDSLIRNSPNNTVLAWGDNWLTAEYIKDGIVTFSYTGLGKKYMVTAELCYPRKYSFVFDELRDLISVRFLEGNKWVNGNRKPKPRPEYGAPSYGLQECFYPEFELFLVIPDTLREMEAQGRRIIFHDDHRNSDVTVELFEIPESEQDDLFKIFHVVARDGDIVLGDDYVHWHNSSGMFLGSASGSTAALMRFEGGDAFYAYEAVYDELICQLIDQYFEPQPLSGGKEPAEEPLEPQPTAGPAEGPLEPQPTAGPTEEPPEPQPTAGPAPAPAVPAGKKAPPKAEPNKIDRVVEKEIAEKTKEEYPPAPDDGNDPLEYYSDADYRAVNTTLEAFVDCYPSEEEMIAGVILKVLCYNGYTEADWYDAQELMLAIGEVLEDIDDGLFEFDLFGTDFRLPADLFPYVCEALDMDFIPEYRNRPLSDPPAPDDVPGAEPDVPDEPGDYPAFSLSWPEHDLYFSEEEVREAEEQVDWYFNYYLDLAKQDEWYQEEGLNSYDGYTLEDAPRFDRIGEDLPHYVGFYQTDSPWYEEDEPEEIFHMMISEDGIWAVYDPDSWEILDYGILIPGSDDYSDMWYTVTADGGFMTLWEFDYGILNTSKYGSLYSAG